jgi:phospholipid/cholesterol/gamma-HCH transport system substrate-binding protein
MLKYRDRKLIRAGFVGAVLICLVIAVGLAPQQLVAIATAVRYQALFADAAGLTTGNDVTVSGLKVGQVSDISLDHDGALVTFSVDAAVALGSDTSAHIGTGTLLGKRVVILKPAGRTRMRPHDRIPLARTSSPYSLTDAVGELTTNTAGTNTAGLNHSLDTLSATLDRVAPQLRPTFDGLTRLSKALNGRNDTLDDLLKDSAEVTHILSDRAQQIDTLILNANDLVGVLSDRRRAIVELLSYTSALSQQIGGLIHDNEAKLAPTLDHLNAVTAMLERSRDNIAKALPGLAKFEVTLGEAISNGPYYNAFVPNLSPQFFIQPFLDYYFGFRRGVNAGQPPDTAGPRAEFPFPYNGIPGGSR